MLIKIFFYLHEEKNKGYIPDGFKSRTILTVYSPVTYKRRIYKYWDEFWYRYVFLADKKLQVERYSRITKHLKFKILNQNLKYNDSNDIKKVKIPQTLYINMDETFVKLRKNKKLRKYRIRLVTFHTGYHKFYSTIKRKALANKRVYYQLLPISRKIDTADFIADVEKMAKKFYSNVENVKIIIGGDGAPWIRNASQYWPNTNYVLDKFHALRYLKQLFPTRFNLLNQQQYQTSKSLFESGTYSELTNHLKQVIIKNEKTTKLKEVVTYFRNNSVGIINQSLDYNIGTSAEGDISHIVKWLLGYGSKAFHYQTFKNMLLLRTAEINQLDIIKYLKNEYHEEKVREQHFYWKSYWSFKNNEEYVAKGSIVIAETKNYFSWLNHS